MRNGSSIIQQIIAMHNVIDSYRDQDIVRQGKELVDLTNELNQLKDNTKPQQYSIEMITVAYNLVRESPDKKLMVTKAIRDRFGLGLRVSKELVDAVSPPYNYPHEG